MAADQAGARAGGALSSTRTAAARRRGTRLLLASTLFALARPGAVLANEYFPVLGAATPVAVARAPVAEPGSEPVVIPRLAGPVRPSASSLLTQSLAPAALGFALPTAPALALGTSGIAYTMFIPPDPIVAAGPNDLVGLVNGGAALFSKSGTISEQRTLNSFFNVPSPNSRFAFDPKVLYDPHSGRFFAAALEGQMSPDSFLYINVSKSSDPANLSASGSMSSDWWNYVIDADRDGGQQINNNWADFTGLGVDADNLYVTANMFTNPGNFRYVKVWIIPKAELLSGATPTIFEIGAPPSPTLGNPDTGYDDFSITPSVNFDDGPEHMLATNSVSVDDTTGFLTVWTVNDPGGTPTLSPANLEVPSFHDLIDVPQCDQKGGGTPLDTGDSRVLNVVERNGTLWAAHTQPDAGGTRAEARWYQIEPSGPSLLQSGTVADPMRCYFYPAIQPDAYGNACVVMTGVDATIYGSAFYTCRLVSDPPGTMQAVATLKAGLTNYDNPPSGSTLNRWGDYGGIAADPVSDDIWMFHEYASAIPNRWGTWLGRIARLPTPAATATPTVTASPTVSPTPSITATASRTPTSSFTPTATATLTPTTTSTSTPTRPPTATATSTATPIALSGDVNCDGRVSAADLPALLPLVVAGGRSACGTGDVNGDGNVDQDDVAALIDRILE